MKVSRIISSVFLVMLLILSLYAPYIERVYSQAGSPVPGANVDIALASDPSYELSTRVNRNGELTLELYQGVNHTFTVRARGYLSKMGEIPAVNNAGPVQQVITLEPAALVEGYVKTPDGKPVVGAIVSSEIDSTFTDSNGYFAVYVEPGTNASISVNAPPDYKALFGNFLNASAMGLPSGYKEILLFLPSVANEFVISRTVYVLVNTQRVQVNVTLDFSARVAGTVTFQNGTPVANATVSIMNPNMVGMGGFGFMAVTDQSGRYEVNKDLPNGLTNVSVTVLGNGWSVHIQNVIENFNVNCATPCTNPQNLDITIPNFVKVTGRLVDKAGRPLPNVFLVGALNNGSYFVRMKTDVNGNFEGYVPQGSQGNLTTFISLFLPPLVSIPINAGNNPINLGDVVVNANLFYVSGTVQGYDPNDLYWRGTSVEIDATISLGFQQFVVNFKGVLFENGSFRIPVYTNITVPFLPIQPNIQFTLVLRNSYRAALLQPPIALPDINQDIANVNVQVNLQPTYQLVLRIEANVQPPQPAQRTLRSSTEYNGRMLNMTVSADTYISSFFITLLIFNPRGELYIYISTLPGTGEYTIEFPTEMLGEPYTLTYYSFETGNEEPLNAQISISNGMARITFTNPEGADTIMVKIMSTNVIPEFNGILLFISIALLAVAALFHRRTRFPNPLRNSTP